MAKRMVDFSFKRAPSLQVATYEWKGPWKDGRIRTEFERVARWASSKGLRTGRWMLIEPSMGKFRVAIEVKGRARGDGHVRVRTLPGSRVASITFDPDAVSARVVYHGLTDWLKWRRKDGEIKSVGVYREVYDGNPWTDSKAWARTEVQAVVR
ncbi:MAG TPA: GyrI-like domain-containing protein [Thermoplasmata archaeon]|nr:GyrI-like domain-containing protein [Thermoplasmata archaeon]